MTVPPKLTVNETRFSGQYGWAVRATLDSANQNAKFCVVSWLLYAPAAHPLWSFHTLDVIRLLPAEDGEKPPVLRFPEATHELLVLSLHPEYQPYTVEDVNRRIRENSGIPFLTPPDVVEQFAASDSEMELLAAYAARAVCHGMLIPDSDFRSQWHSSLEKTLAHIRGEEHEP